MRYVANPWAAVILGTISFFLGQIAGEDLANTNRIVNETGLALFGWLYFLSTFVPIVPGIAALLVFLLINRILRKNVQWHMEVAVLVTLVLGAVAGFLSGVYGRALYF